MKVYYVKSLLCTTLLDVLSKTILLKKFMAMDNTILTDNIIAGMLITIMDTLLDIFEAKQNNT